MGVFDIQCNADSGCEHIKGGGNIYLFVNLLVPVFTVCMTSNQGASKSHAIFVKPTVNLTPCCIEYSKVILVLRYLGSASVGPSYH